jgi:hypothetical protein
VADQNAVRAAPCDADGDPQRKGVLGGFPLSHTAIPEPKQVEHFEARLWAISASQRLVYDEIAETADFIESFAIGLREAARRGDRPRVHS